MAGPDGSHRWYTLHEDRLRDALELAHRGQDPDDIMLALWSLLPNSTNDDDIDQDDVERAGGATYVIEEEDQ